MRHQPNEGCGLGAWFGTVCGVMYLDEVNPSPGGEGYHVIDPLVYYLGAVGRLK